MVQSQPQAVQKPGPPVVLEQQQQAQLEDSSQWEEHSLDTLMKLPTMLHATRTSPEDMTGNDKPLSSWGLHSSEGR